jgi:hypothetical protein
MVAEPAGPLALHTARPFNHEALEAHEETRVTLAGGGGSSGGRRRSRGPTAAARALPIDACGTGRPALCATPFVPFVSFVVKRRRRSWQPDGAVLHWASVLHG